MSNKKYPPDRLYNLVVEHIRSNFAIGDKVYAEKVALHFKTATHYVKQVFHKLNLEGRVSQSINDYGGMHCREDMHGDCVLQWSANHYIVYEKMWK